MQLRSRTATCLPRHVRSSWSMWSVLLGRGVLRGRALPKPTDRSRNVETRMEPDPRKGNPVTIESSAHRQSFVGSGERSGKRGLPRRPKRRRLVSTGTLRCRHRVAMEPGITEACCTLCGRGRMANVQKHKKATGCEDWRHRLLAVHCSLQGHHKDHRSIDLGNGCRSTMPQTVMVCPILSRLHQVPVGSIRHSDLAALAQCGNGPSIADSRRPAGLVP